MAAIRLLLVDDQHLSRECLAAALNRRRQFNVVADCASAGAARIAVEQHRPDLVILEPLISDGGAPLIGDLDARVAGCRVLVLTRDGYPADVGRFVRAGARGYLRTTSTLADLIQAIVRVHQGDLVVTSTGTESVVNSLSGAGARQAAQPAVTPRELDVLALVSQGRTNAEIARELSITEHTVKGHLANLLAKLGVDNRTQLATRAAQHVAADSIERPAGGPAEPTAG